MTEFEYLIKNEDQGIKEALSEVIGKVNGKITLCKDIECNECDFYLKDDCRASARKWLDEEHIEKPLPCPFCGSENVYLYENACYVECDDCSIETRCYDTTEEAIEAWNRRA